MTFILIYRVASYASLGSVAAGKTVLAETGQLHTSVNGSSQSLKP